MTEKLALLHPEIALFITATIVMILGLSPRRLVRKSCAVITGVGLIVAAVFSWNSPAMSGMFPGLLPYGKTVVTLVALLILPLLTGLVDRDYEADVARGERFDPLRTMRGEFYSFFLFSVMGVLLCVSADDLIWLFLALELTSLPTYVMVATSSHRLRAQEAGVKYFFLGALGAAIFLYGFAMLYGATGTTDIPDIARRLATSGISPIATLGVVMAIVGIAFKIAAAPMHFYTADVYQGAASPVTAYLAFAPKAAGFFALMHILSTVGWRHGDGASLPADIRVVLWVMAALTMTVGNVLALLQTSVKRLLAYSSIAHSGYMLVGLLVGPALVAQSLNPRDVSAQNGLAAMLFYLLTYGVMTAGVFAVIACLETRTPADHDVELDSIEDLKGLCRRQPLLGWALVLCALSLLGLPPLLGFFGKLFLFTSAIAAHEYVLVIVMSVNAAIGAVYYLRLALGPLVDEPNEFRPRARLIPSWPRQTIAVVSAVGVVALAFWITPIQFASNTATQAATPESSVPVAIDSASPSRGLQIAPIDQQLKPLP
ncbi:MAG: NADH-quinone oxidoreductase subunit N [Phycisphaeraceae bacterium]|nr:NADH-quinone oxidoreductase subunit N [Phycisphaeraceae bacterium]